MDSRINRIELQTEAGILGLRRELAMRPGKHRVLILCDPTLDDPLRNSAQEYGLPCHPVFLHSHLATPPKPYLIEIEDEPECEPLVNRSIRIAVEQALLPSPANRRSRSVCAWLLTARPGQDIAHDIAARSKIIDDLGQRRLLRFWDPRTTQHMAGLYPGTSPRSWLPGVTWGYIDSFGQWQLLPRSDAASAISAPTWERTSQYSTINLVLQRLSVHGMDHTADVVEDIIEALRIGRDIGFADEGDLTCYASHRVQYAAPIELAPRIATILQEVRRFGVSYRNRVDELNEEDWISVLAEIPHRAAKEQEKRNDIKR